MQVLKVGISYFALVFGAGFVLGPIRLLWVVPRVGTRAAELLEAPIMLAVIIVAARWLVEPRQREMEAPWNNATSRSGPASSRTAAEGHAFRPCDTTDIRSPASVILIDSDDQMMHINAYNNAYAVGEGLSCVRH